MKKLIVIPAIFIALILSLPSKANPLVTWTVGIKIEFGRGSGCYGKGVCNISLTGGANRVIGRTGFGTLNNVDGKISIRIHQDSLSSEMKKEQFSGKTFPMQSLVFGGDICKWVRLPWCTIKEDDYPWLLMGKYYVIDLTKGFIQEKNETKIIIAEQANSLLANYPTEEQMKKNSPYINKLLKKLRALLDLLRNSKIDNSTYDNALKETEQLISVELANLKLADLPTERSVSVAKNITLKFSRETDGTGKVKLKNPKDWCWECIGAFVKSLFE